MGFLNVKGGVLTYNEYKQKKETYKKHGVMQFVSLYNSQINKNIPLKDLKWGEEMEYLIYSNDSQNQKVKLANRGPELIQVFNDSNLSMKNDIILMPEFGGWMVEAVPSKPYNSIIDATELLSCEDKLHKRRHILNDFFQTKGLQIISMPNACMLGTEDHIDLGDDQETQDLVDQNKGDLSSINQFSQSQFVIDKTINSHPRFSGLVKSIRERREKKVEIKVPLYKDEKTNMTEATKEEPFPGQIYMDAMHFGMGQCCLQITYECSTMNHARYLHDMLLPFTGIMAALSASGPIQKGKLSDNDLRWTVIEQSTDCRTDSERDPKSSEFIPKSRYSAMNHYISDHQYVQDTHNDGIQVKINQEYKTMLQQNTDIDERLANHVARLFTRDPVPAYEGEFLEEQIDDTDLVSHFENLQSTNWNSLRFKPPPSQQSEIGWRVEFRTLDIQLTDFENTCLIVAIGLIVNIINHYDVDFIIPITLADENMKRSHYRNAVLNQKFWFNTNSIKKSSFTQGKKTQDYFQKSDYKLSSEEEKIPAAYHELTITEILGGKPELNFSGIYPLITQFMKDQQYDQEHVQQIDHILDFLMARAQGSVPTGANFIRQFILKHSLYNKDSIVSAELHNELFKEIMKLNQGEVPCDCEKQTDSDSCNIDCAHQDDVKKWLENNLQFQFDFDDDSHEGSFGQEPIVDSPDKKFEIFDENIDTPLNQNNQSNDKNQMIFEEQKQQEIIKTEQITESPSKQDLLNTKNQNGAYNTKYFKKIMQISERNSQARKELLGDEWFQGRTGLGPRENKLFFQTTKSDEQIQILKKKSSSPDIIEPTQIIESKSKKQLSSPIQNDDQIIS